MPNIVELVVRLSDKLTQPLGQLESRIKGFSVGLGTLLTGAAVAAAGAFTGLVVAGFKSADALGDAAERAGVAVDSLSRLKFAAEQSDVEFGSLVIAVKRWQVALSNAATGGKETADVFKALQLNAEELKSLSLEDQLARIADQFTRIQDPADRTRIAVELFGRAGEQLVPLLAQGGAGIKQLTDKADELGITLDQNTTRAVDKADKALKQLKATLDSFAQRTAGSIAEFIIGPVDNIDAAQRRLDELVRRRDEILKGSVRLPGPARDAQLAQLNAQIKGQEELLAVVQRMEAESEKIKNPLSIPNEGNDKLLEQLQQIQVSLSLLPDPLIEWEKQTRTSIERITADFDEFEAHLNALVAAGKVTVDEAQKRTTEKLDDILKPVEVSVTRLQEPLTAAQQKAKEFTDTLAEGLANAARQGNVTGKSILRSLLAAFESKAIFNAIDAIASALRKALAASSSGGGGFLDTLIGAFTGAQGAGAATASHGATGSFATGTAYIPKTGMYQLHKGEAVVNATDNRKMDAPQKSGPVTLHYSARTEVHIHETQFSPQQAAALVDSRIAQNNRRQRDELQSVLERNGIVKNLR